MPLQKQQGSCTSSLGIQQEYEATCLPIGLHVRINLYSTHGDPYYIGLNGIELFDQLGSLIEVSAKEHTLANPPGINRLPGMERDLRTIDKLFNGQNIT